MLGPLPVAIIITQNQALHDLQFQIVRLVEVFACLFSRELKSFVSKERTECQFNFPMAYSIHWQLPLPITILTRWWIRPGPAAFWSKTVLRPATKSKSSCAFSLNMANRAEALFKNGLPVKWAPCLSCPSLENRLSLSDPESLRRRDVTKRKKIRNFCHK